MNDRDQGWMMGSLKVGKKGDQQRCLDDMEARDEGSWTPGVMVLE
jgi:hypothetical protein